MTTTLTRTHPFKKALRWLLLLPILALFGFAATPSAQARDHHRHRHGYHRYHSSRGYHGDRGYRYGRSRSYRRSRYRHYRGRRDAYYGPAYYGPASGVSVNIGF